MSDLFDIDAEVASYRPLTVKLRGVEYVIGGTAADLLKVSQFAAQLDGKGHEALAAIAGPVFASLVPTAPTDLNEAEQAALLRPLVEVLNRLSAVNFR